MEEAINAAMQMESSHGSITFDTAETSRRYTFRYEGAVHACNLPDEWEIVGFGSQWFSIQEV